MSAALGETSERARVVQIKGYAIAWALAFLAQGKRIVTVADSPGAARGGRPAPPGDRLAYGTIRRMLPSPPVNENEIPWFDV